MKQYHLSLESTAKEIYAGHIRLGGRNPDGDEITFTNYYMERNAVPYFGICGEFHYTRYDKKGWEDEILKMKMGGINIIATYIFWIHHEEEEGRFEWNGNKDLRRFVELCAKHGLQVIIRVGPFCHGEVRNGGLPDWLYGRPFRIRSNDEGYLFYVRRLFKEIGKQVAGLMYKDGGPIVGVQLENEYMSAAAPWETTPPQVHEWTGSSNEGKEHMKVLKELALAAGLDAPIYTCTGWGGSPVLEDEILPLYGDYAFWPWIFYGDVNEHPATHAYIFQDYHNNTSACHDFNPPYPRERYPYACCEMGGGMQVWYNYRFTVPPESVEAMTIMKVAGGCNFIGYYMFHGGSNPVGKHSYMNERSCPKISYDFQAPLGEFGQVRESYARLRLLHYFLQDYQDYLCPMKTVLPDTAGGMTPQNTDILRFAARVKERSGFLFLNNYQDHWDMRDHENFNITLLFQGEQVTVPENGGLTLKKDVCCIFPFHLDMDGLCLKYATTQLITSIKYNDEKYYFFFIPEGMKGEYCFSSNGIRDVHGEGCTVNRSETKIFLYVRGDSGRPVTIETDGGHKIHILTLTKEDSLKLWKVDLWGHERILFTDANVLAGKDGLKLECVGREKISLGIFPDKAGEKVIEGAELLGKNVNGIFYEYVLALPAKAVEPEITRIGDSKAVLRFTSKDFAGVKEILLSVNYRGDVGYAYIDGKLINDNFCNGTSWEIGLKGLEKELSQRELYLYISPIKKGSYVKNDSPMAARMEIAGEETAVIDSIHAVSVYEVLVR